MKKRTWIILGLFFAVGCFLYFFGSMQSGAPSPLDILENHLPQKQHASQDSRDEARLQDLDLSSVRDIEIDVVAADIELVVGEQWALDYDLSERELMSLDTQLREGQLTIKTGVQPGIGVTFGGYVKITVPADGYLRNVALNSVSGKIQVDNLGAVGELSLHSVSGSCEVGGTVADAIEMKTVSGDIVITSPAVYDIEAKTTGSILVNGTKVGSRYESERDGLPEMELKSTSGKIRVETEVGG